MAQILKEAAQAVLKAYNSALPFTADNMHFLMVKLDEALEGDAALSATQAEIDKLKMALDGADIENQVLRKRLSAAPTPPEVEPIHQWHYSPMWCDCSKEAFIAYKSMGCKTRILFTSPPSPKAEEVEALKAEIAHWKANHRNMVDRSRVLMDRTDLPLERVKAFSQIGDYQAEIERLKTSAKAEYDAEGNPLTLLAAAKDALRCADAADSVGLKLALTDLRKFIGEDKEEAE